MGVAFACAAAGGSGERQEPVRLVVHYRPQNRDREVRQLGRPVVQLQPSDGTMLFEVARHASLGDSQVLRHALPQQTTVLASTASAKQVADADTQGLAGLNIVVRHLVGVGEQQYPRAGGRLVGVVE